MTITSVFPTLHAIKDNHNRGRVTDVLSNEGTPKAHRALLLAANKGPLKSQHQRLKQLFDNDAWTTIDTLDLVDKLLAMTNHVLNPAGHGNEAPLYEEEVAKALDIVRQFGTRQQH